MIFYRFFQKKRAIIFVNRTFPEGLRQILSEKAKARDDWRKFIFVAAAYSAALKASETNDLIFVGGSTFVVAEMDL